MADIAMPTDVTEWMQKKGWGPHHDQWHFERRWDFWHFLAQQPDADADVKEMVATAKKNGWTRAAIQEGEPGNGEDFLFMHRAMFQLLLRNFPHHFHLFRGWNTPPQDPADLDDPLPKGATTPFSDGMRRAITKLEARLPAFDTDDAFGLYLETNLRPAPGNPVNRSTDPELGLHNYLHNRWSDDTPISLGDPRVNIFNQRFWKLHGWLDFFWWKFRAARKLDDASPEYQAKLKAYVDMMNMDAVDHGGHHHTMAAPSLAAPIRPRNVFRFDFVGT